MKKNITSEIRLVITVALKKELPIERLEKNNIPVLTLAAVRSGALKNSSSGMLVLITGAGLKASEEAACWIRDNLKPFFVVNIGTCGLTDKRRSTGKWLRPRHVSDEDGSRLELDDRLPLPFPEKTTDISSLLSVKKAVLGNIPSAWKDHDAIDMECFAQAKVFQETGITFHCLKFGTDFSDGNTIDDFNRNLELFREAVKRLFAFSTPHTGGITAMIPVHNREHTIQRALDSVLSQSVMPDEIIVVDDASTDRTGEILKGYGGDITLITLAENSGPSRARNEGVSHAKTEWIAFLDSDDCWERDKLKNQTAYLKQYLFYQIMQSDEIWIRNGKRVNPCKHHRKPEGWIWEQSLERCLVSPSGVLIKRSLLQQYGGFDEGLPVCEDYDLWLKISRCHPVGLDPVPSVIKHGGHADQLSRRYPAMDSFRVRSLYRMLKNEHSPAYCRKIISVLEKKLAILISGYEKRNRADDVRECREMLEALQQCRRATLPMQGQTSVSA